MHYKKLKGRAASDLPILLVINTRTSQLFTLMLSKIPF